MTAPLALVCLGDWAQAFSAELYTGCNFGCRYCLPVGRRWADQIGPLAGTEGICERVPRVRSGDPLNIAKLAQLRASRYGRGTALPPVFLSLTCDPYPELEETAGAMRNAIERLHLYNVGVRVLTKSGTRACRDFQPAPDDPRADRPASAANLGSHPDDAFGATLSFLDEAQSRKWEPRAAPPAERMAGLEEAHRRGIPTWINLAPVVDPEQSLEIIRRTHEYVGLYNAGALSEYDSSEAPIDWADFAERAVDLCRQHHVPCYVRLDTQAGSEAPELGVARMVATKLLDSLMCEEMWRGMCLARKPAWGVGAPCGKDALKAALEWSCVRQTGLW